MSNDAPERMVIHHENFIKGNHATLAKLAQSQYSKVGRGIVVISLDQASGIGFHWVGPDQFSGKTRNDILTYDPEREFMLAIPNPDNSRRTYLLPLQESLAFNLEEPLGAVEKPPVAEIIFNLFVYVGGDIINEVGVTPHGITGGTDPEKMAFLQSLVNDDFRKAKRYRLPITKYPLLDGRGKRTSGITYGTFLGMYKANKHLSLFEPAFKEMKAPQAPLYCLTPIVNGRPQINVVMKT